MEKKELDMKISKNFLPQKDFDGLKTLMEATYFPWYFNPGVVRYPGVKTPVNHFQFTHAFYGDGQIRSDYFKNLTPLFNIIKPALIVRIKANLLTLSDKIIKHSMHQDFVLDNAKITTGIFYINSNNGMTIFENGKKIKSEANKYVEFDSNTMHTGTTCTDDRKRIVINLNYIK